MHSPLNVQIYADAIHFLRCAIEECYQTDTTKFIAHFTRSARANNGLFKVNLEMAIFGFDLENEISVCVRNWELKTWVLKPRFENPDSWLLSKKAIIN